MLRGCLDLLLPKAVALMCSAMQRQLPSITCLACRLHLKQVGAAQKDAALHGELWPCTSLELALNPFHAGPQLRTANDGKQQQRKTGHMTQCPASSLFFPCAGQRCSWCAANGGLPRLHDILHFDMPFSPEAATSCSQLHIKMSVAPPIVRQES